MHAAKFTDRQADQAEPQIVQPAVLAALPHSLPAAYANGKTYLQQQQHARSPTVCKFFNSDQVA